MAAEAILLRTTAFLARTSWRKEFCDGLRDSTLRLGRSRWTTGESVGAQADCEKGALIADATKRILCFARLDGTGTSDATARRALMTPLRASWHYSDASGVPTLDNRVVQGDSLVYDSGSSDRYLLHYDSVAGAFKGLGVLAEYRTAATSTTADTRNQPSERLTMRASKWDTTGTPAAKYRDWSLSVFTSDAGSDSYSGLKFTRQNEGGALITPMTLDSNGYFYITGDVPGFEINANGAGIAYLRLSASDPDGSILKFAHSNESRWGRFRLYGAYDSLDGVNADVLSVEKGSDATALTPIQKSPAIVHWASGWDGSKGARLGHYTQLTPTSGTEAYLEHGFNFDDGVIRLHQHGLIESLSTSTGGLRLGQYTTATVSNTTVDSSTATWRASYFDGTAFDADWYAQHVLDSATPAGRMRLNSSYGVGIVDLYSDGAAVFTMDRDGTSTYGGALTIVPHATSGPSGPDYVHSPVFSAVAYSGAAAAVRLIGWIAQIDSSADVDDKWSMRVIAMGDSGPNEILGIRSTGEMIPADGSAGIIELSAALGTHTGTTASDKTGNTKVGTLKVVDNTGTIIGHVQLYADA